MKIKEPIPNMIKREALIADKIASIAIPSTGISVWDRYIEAKKASGNMGVFMPASGGLGARVTTPKSTGVMKSLQMQLGGYETRSEMARRTGLRLPNLGYIPRTGIASTASQKKKFGQGGIEEQVDGGVGAAAQSGDTEFVDDQGWPVTLKQLLGSRLLTTELLEKASIQNVRSFMTVNGGTQQQRSELEYMMQRAILEGFVRGVDITQELKSGGIKMNLKAIDGSVIGRRYNSGNADAIDFDTNFWNKKDEGAQYTLFLHEVVGHALLNVDADHNLGGGSTKIHKSAQSERIMTPVYKDSVLENYDKMMDDLFNESSVPSHNKFQVQDMGTASYYDKSWFPAISGVTSNGGLNGSAATATADAINKGEESVRGSSHQIGGGSDTQGTITPGQVTPGGEISGQPTMGASLSSDIQTATKTFAAGMADLSKAGPDMSQAGMLLKSG